MGEVNTVKYYNGYGIVTRLDRYRNGAIVRQTGFARMGGDVTRNGTERWTIDLHIIKSTR